MKTLYQYAIVRFLPHAETGEFANVGIVLCAPEQGHVEFRLAPNRFARVTDFFQDVKGALYKTAIQTVQQELKRVQEYAAGRPAAEVAALVQEVVRPRESLLRYSELRTMLVDKKPAAVADQLFEQLIHRTFLTEEYQEQLMTRAIKAQLKAEKMQHFRERKLADRFDEITFPLVAETNDYFVIRPLAFGQKTAIKVLDHANSWLGRLTRYTDQQILKKTNILLPLQGPDATAPTKLREAFAEVQHNFANAGLPTIAYQDQTAISAFARQSLASDGFVLRH